MTSRGAAKQNWPPSPLPIIKAPMAATEVKRPFHHPGWIFEEKNDGWWVLAYKDAAGVRLVSRNARDLTRRFPELAAAVAAPEILVHSRPGEVSSVRWPHAPSLL